MKVGELKAKLDGFRPFILVSGREIDRNDPNVVEFIDFYYKLTGKRVGEGSCRNCILDAYMELSIKTEKQLKRLVMPSRFKLKEGRVVVFQNTDYTNANITDEVAMKMIDFSSKHAGNFQNPSEVLEAFGKSRPKKGKEKVTIVENEVNPNEESKEDKPAPSLEELKDRYKKKFGRKPHWKWDEDKILEKLNED